MDEAHRTAACETYLVEGYYPGVSTEQLRQSAGRLLAMTEEMGAQGEPVRFLRATIVPKDESCLVLIEAASEAHVREAYARAAIPFERISTAISDED